MEPVTIPKAEYEEPRSRYVQELYKQLLAFQVSVKKHGEFTRKDLRLLILLVLLYAGKDMCTQKKYPCFVLSSLPLEASGHRAICW